MTGHAQAQWRIVTRTFGCAMCGAPPGQPCITLIGGTPRLDGEYHAARTSAASAHHWLAADVPIVCEDCGNDVAVVGYLFCSDCLESGEHERR